MLRLLAASAVLALLVSQSQATPPATPPTSPFAAAVSKPPDSTGELVSLAFDWPPGLTATIDVRANQDDDHAGRTEDGDRGPPLSDARERSLRMAA